MYKHNILFIGLDTHKVPTKVAHVEDQRGAKPVHQGEIKTTKAAITKWARQYKRLMQRGKHRNVVVAAIAREMVAYIWAISREVVLVPIDPKTRLSRVPA